MPPSATSLISSLEEVIQRGDFVVPPYPAAALRLRRIVETAEFGLAEVAEAASSDASLAATLLRVANTANLRGEGAPITNLARAVHRLGAKGVSSLALTAGVSAAALAAGPLVEVKYRVWRRSVSCALISQTLAAQRQKDPEAAFLAGLLHSFGRCVAVGCLERTLPSQPSTAARPLAEWLEALEPNRHTLARKVAERWQLPTEIVETLAAPANAAAPGSLAALVNLADSIAAALDRGATTELAASEAGVSGAEQRRLVTFLGSLPQAIEALLEVPETKRRGTSLSAVSKPPTSLSGEPRRLFATLTNLKNRKVPELLDPLAVTPDGLVFFSEHPMQESYVARIGIGTPPNTVEGWFSVSLCTHEKARFRIEVQAFAPSRELRDQLTELWHGALKR